MLTPPNRKGFLAKRNRRTTLLTVGQQTTAGTNEIYCVDLSASAPSAPRKLNATLASGASVNDAGFTADSTKAYYVAGGSLFLVDLGNTTAVGQLVLPSYTSVQFQP